MPIPAVPPSVLAVSRDGFHRFSKVPCAEITLVAGLGVLGDAHAGTLVQHRSRVRRDPNQPNLRQVHLIHAELFDEVAAAGHAVAPGELGENVTTVGVPLLELPTGTRLHVGDAVLRLTGLRNPCRQIDDFQPGLLKAVLPRGERRAGVMAVVEQGGVVRPGQPVGVRLPDGPHEPLVPV